MLRLPAAVAAALLCAAGGAQAHDWYPPNCCSGHDCRPMASDGVTLSAGGLVIKESGETIPYDSPLVKRTPPEGGGLYHRCSVGGAPQGATICIYVPDWGT